MIRTDTWYTTIVKALFTVFMLSLMVWCCSGCTPEPIPVSVDKARLKKHTNDVMAEETVRINAEMERRWR